jgi:predicted membrane-bound spermidine synthase
VLSVFLPLLLGFVSGVRHYGEPLFFVLIFAYSSFAGIIYPLAISEYKKEAISTLGGFYFFDLIGSAFGSLAASIFLIPVLGIPVVSVACGIGTLLLAFFVRSGA